MKKFLIILCIVFAGFSAWHILGRNAFFDSDTNDTLYQEGETGFPAVDNSEAIELHPLMIEALRAREYPGSDLIVEETLAQGSNYGRYVASYQSDGLKIYGLLTIPQGQMPADGYPAIVFNHGYIPPGEYRTTERYVAYVDGFARAGYVVFKIDYRGHGNSEGEARGAHYDPGYVIDVLNAVGALKRHDKVNPEKIGMWGHSMGGHLTITAMVVSPDIKGGVIWAGVTGTYDEFFDRWRNRRRTQTEQERAENFRRQGGDLIAAYGEPRQASDFWRAVSPVNFLDGISGPVELHHATGDETVPVEFSEDLFERLLASQAEAELFIYRGGDHNLSGPHFSPALRRSVDFFNRHVGGSG